MVSRCREPAEPSNFFTLLDDVVQKNDVRIVRMQEAWLCVKSSCKVKCCVIVAPSGWRTLSRQQIVSKSSNDVNTPHKEQT